MARCYTSCLIPTQASLSASPGLSPEPQDDTGPQPERETLTASNANSALQLHYDGLMKKPDRVETSEAALKDMYSFVAHAIHNALGTAPEALRQALAAFRGTRAELSQAEASAINTVASVIGTITFVENLTQNFKIMIADPERLREAWLHDSPGPVTVPMVLAAALRQALARIFFAAGRPAPLMRLLGNGDKAARQRVRRSFIDVVLSRADPETHDPEGTALLDWVQDNLPGLRIHVDADNSMGFASDGVRFVILFSVFGELIHNALKHSSGPTPVTIDCQVRNGRCRCEVRNPCAVDIDGRPAHPSFSRRGLASARRVLEALPGADLVTEAREGQFSATLQIPLTRGETTRQ